MYLFENKQLLFCNALNQCCHKNVKTEVMVHEGLSCRQGKYCCNVTPGLELQFERSFFLLFTSKLK